MKPTLKSIRELEDEVTIRFGTGRGMDRAAQGQSVRQALRRLRVRSRGGGDSRAPRGGAAGGGSGGGSRRQRVVMKASYKVHRPGKARATLRSHVRYLARDSASLDGEPGRFYDARSAGDDIDAKAAVARFKEREWENDRHHFRFIVSPERGDLVEKHGGLTLYTRELMHQVERDLRTKLDWVAINHHNTDQPHAHVVVRGKRDNGEDLVIPRDTIKHGLREEAEKLATRWLVERTLEQAEKAAQKEVTAERYTGLDAAIERHIDQDRRVRLPRRLEYRRHAAGRLQHLERYGLAEKDNKGRWTVRADLRQTLNDLGLRQEIVRDLYPKIGDRSASVIRFEPGRDGRGVAGYVVAVGKGGEQHDQRYLVVQDQHDRMHFVRVANREALEHLEEGGLVKVTGVDRARAQTDARIAEVARRNGGVYSVKKHRERLPPTLGERDREGLLASYRQRVETLTRREAAAPEGRSAAGKWRINDPAALERGAYAEIKAVRGVLEVVAHRSVESQVSAEAWTWLDRQMHRRSLGKPTEIPFDARLEKAAEARRCWMIGQLDALTGPYKPMPGTAEKLRRAELERAARRIGPEHGKPVRELPQGDETDGAYRGTVALHQGLRIKIDDDRNLYLASVKRTPPLERGTRVNVRVADHGWSMVKKARPRERERDRGLELG